jgi:hypothetical protein
MIRAALLAVFAAAVLTGPAAAGCKGSRNCPIEVHIARGANTVVLAGRARAGQRLYWRLEGAALRTVLKYPNGDVDGPGVPNGIQLPTSGRYVFDVHPNLMADGAYGWFRLTLTIQ